MIIKRQIDIEDEIRQALAPYMRTYCRPLPASPDIPCVLVQQVGGSARNDLNSFEITLDARGRTDAEAMETIRNAVGLLQTIAKSQDVAISYATVNTLAAWGSDPVRPDLALATARLTVYTHPEAIDMEETHGNT